MMHSAGLRTPPDGRCLGKCRVLQSIYADMMLEPAMISSMHELNNVTHKLLKPFLKALVVIRILKIKD